MGIVVIGAYGYTGKLICQEFDESGISYLIAGRNELALDQFIKECKNATRALCIDISVESDVHELLKCAEIIVNCAGPYEEESTFFISQVARSGKKYIDITGEVGVLRNSFDELDETATSTNSLILHGCAFESLIVDLILQTNSEKVCGLKTYYWFNENRVSPGTKLTMKLSRYRILYCVLDNDWATFQVEHRFPVRFGEEEFIAVPYPLPEIAFAKSRFQCQNAQSFILLTNDEAKYVTHSSSPNVDLAAELERLKKRKSKGPTEEQRNRQRSEIVIEFEGEQTERKEVVVENKDMYGTTAKAVRLSVQELLKDNIRLSGVQCPARLFSGKEEMVLSALNVVVLNKTFKSLQC